MNKKLISLVFVLGFMACKRQEEKTNTGLLYFDVNGYFKEEANRLSKTKPIITKEVAINGVPEQKRLQINDWTKELAIFSNADINKASWKGSFKVEKDGNLESYISDNKKIPVKKVLISKENQKVKSIEIIITSKNILYTSGDTLSYYPDSLYRISKHQKIRLLKLKNYQVTGKFK
ncbi:hypothetical protein [Pedobacter aquatilis]|uniref:hypothetical protein n=1 Tax=Pedobacter aquatilis TaxID=351343 RepID=UPI00292EC42B|nr:hypothetical protein [Pedobacter aquatilis]